MAHAGTGRGPASRRDAGPVRLPALDGVRGIAAAVVVVHHALLTWPALAGQYFGADPGSWTWWLTFTPLHLAWAGTEAVMVFFVLSGFVLARPFLAAERPGRSGRRWPAWYGQRLVRLHPPVLASLLLAAALVHAFPRVADPAASWWSAMHVAPLDRGTLATDALLLGGTSLVNSPLWSLQWEVAFCLLLPGYVLVCRWLGERSVWLLPLLLGLGGLGLLHGSAALSWLPVFGIGVVAAAVPARVARLGARLAAARHPAAAGAALLAGALVLLLAEWWGRALHLETTAWAGLARALALAGAGLVCLLPLVWPALVAVLCAPPLQWLGRLSFSLYLVHEPLLVSVSTLTPPSGRGAAVTLVVGVLLALPVAVAFHHLVERPTHRLARRVGRAAAGPPATRPAPEPAGPGTRPIRVPLPVPSSPRG